MKDEEILKYKVKNCKVCNTPTNPNDTEELFCSQCGAPIVNHCSNYNCGIVLNEDARYCKKCGSPSIFNTSGIFDNTFSIQAPEDTDDLPF